MVVAGAVAGSALLVASLRRLVPPGTLVARRGLPATILGRGLLTCSFFAGDAYVPYAITTVRHAPTGLGALALTAATMTWTVGAWVQARWINRIGPRRLVRLGEGLVFAGLVLMSVTLLPSVPPALGVAAWAIGGFGIGQAYAPLSVTTLDRATPGQEGRATSGLQLFDVLGQAIGTGVAGAIVAGAAGGLGHRVGVALAFGFALLVSVIAVLAGAHIPSRLLSSAQDDPAAAPPGSGDVP